MVLDENAVIGWGKHAVPHGPGPTISRHADNPSVVPEAATALTGERQPAMSSDHAVATRSRQFLFDRSVTGREDEGLMLVTPL